MPPKQTLVVRCSTVLSIVLVLSGALIVALEHHRLSHLLDRFVQALQGGETNASTQRKTDSLAPHSGANLALMECLRLVAPVAAEVEPVAPIRDRACGTAAPVFLLSLGREVRVAIDPPLLLNCPMVVALDRWMERVQAAAVESFGSPVARVIGSSYSCRTAYSRDDTRLSQHAFANAIDLPVFVLANGQTVNIAKEWGATRRDLAAARARPTASVAGRKPADRPITKQTGGDRIGSKSATLTVAMKKPTEAGSPSDKLGAPVPLVDSSTPHAKFWRRIHHDACDLFSTVLGPEANDAHRDHLHLDLQERSAPSVCR
jgi:hypothetical protein